MGNETYFYHHGILGMKWGVRRYQNEDGSYTKAGLERYRKKSEAYDKARSNYKSVKEKYKSGDVTKDEYKEAKAEMNSARRARNTEYENLSQRKLADEGKRLYGKGKTISENVRKSYLKTLGISALDVAGIAAVNAFVSDEYKRPVGALINSATVIAAGADWYKTHKENAALRAYYAKSFNSDDD